MSDKKAKTMIANTFLEVADAFETGQYGKKPVIGFALEDSEHGQDNVEEAMKTTEMKGLKAVPIEGEDPHKRMEEMLDSGKIDSAVTIHYPSSIGVSTIGKVVAPGKGKPMYIVITTGMSDTDCTSDMAENVIYGIIAAKANGVENPTVGIADIDGARQIEKVLLKLAENGYDINFTESVRVDGGIIMRGNDLLGGIPDVMVMDSLTGNLVMKISSPYTTGGNYESLELGYGPGVGEGYDRLIMIMLRAFGAPIIVGAMEHVTDLTRHDWRKIADEESEKANKAGLKDVINELKSAGKKDADAATEEVKMSPKEIVISRIPGIGAMDPGDAAKALWKAGIYAESGMGCTGPIVLMSDVNKDKAHEILRAARYVS